MNNLKLVNAVMNIMGRDTLTAISSDDWGEVIDVAIDNSKNFLLKKAPWQFAEETAYLSKLSSPIDPDYDYSYQIPSDFVRVNDIATFNVIDGRNRKLSSLLKSDYRLYKDTLSTNIVDNIMLQYVSSSVDINSESGAFQNMYAYYVASRVAATLTQMAKLVPYFERMHKEDLNEAMMLNAKQMNNYKTWANTVNL